MPAAISCCPVAASSPPTPKWASTWPSQFANTKSLVGHDADVFSADRWLLRDGETPLMYWARVQRVQDVAEFMFVGGHEGVPREVFDEFRVV